MCGKSGSQLQWRCGEIRAKVFIVGTMGEGSAEDGSKFMREKRVRLAKGSRCFCVIIV